MREWAQGVRTAPPSRCCTMSRSCTAPRLCSCGAFARPCGTSRAISHSPLSGTAFIANSSPPTRSFLPPPSSTSSSTLRSDETVSSSSSRCGSFSVAT
eukprot:6207232-Pleurochrysis_carterae.AAC.9